MKRIILQIVAAAFVSFGAGAVVIDVTPGSLGQNSVTLTSVSDSEVILRGSADVTDLMTLVRTPRCVRKIDMGGLEIVPYSFGDKGHHMGQRDFAAGELPQGVMMSGSLEQVVLPSGLKMIGASAFAGSHLRSVTVPASVTQIGDKAFANCRNLSDVVISSADVKLGKGVFQGDAALRNVKFGGTVTEIPEAFFDGCVSLATPFFPQVTKVGAYAYRATPFTTLDLTNVREAGDFAFADMPNLVEVVLSSSHDMRLGKGVFFSDSNLGISNVAALPLGDFFMANAGGSATVLVDSPEIGAAAFANNGGIEEVKLGASVRKVGDHAFRNLSALKMIDVRDLGENVPAVTTSAFEGLPLSQEGGYEVQLNVNKKDADTWRAHDVWGRFQIISGGSAVGAITESSISLSLTRDKNTINVKSNDVIDFIGVYSLAGMVLHESNPAAEVTEIHDMPSDEVLIVKVMSGDRVHMVKLK